MDVERGQIQGGPGSRWGLSAAEQSIGLVGRSTLGHIYATDCGGARVPGAQKRVALAPRLASLQRTDSGPRDGLRPGLRPLEDLGSLIQAVRAGDGDPQTRPAPAQRVTQAAAHDAGGHPADVGQPADWRHPAGDDRRPEAGPAPGRPPGPRASQDPGRIEAQPPRAADSRSRNVVKTWSSRVWISLGNR